MAKYEFRLVLAGSHELTEEVADKLFEASCDDGTPGQSDGVLSIDICRQGQSLEKAIRSAISNVRSTGYEVDRVEMEADAVAEHA